MSRGGGGSIMPIIGLVVLGLVLSIGVIIFGASMQSAYVEGNFTAENETLIPYEIATAWYGGAAILVFILAIMFAFYYFMR
jgi:nitric oxide reductase large subunit